MFQHSNRTRGSRPRQPADTQRDVRGPLRQAASLATLGNSLAERDRRTALQEFLVGLIEERDYVSFVEVARFGREAGFVVDGDWVVTWETDENLILWYGVSGELVNCLGGLLAARSIFMEPAGFGTYFADGAVLNLPVAKRPPAGGYKRPHWLPVVFRVVPF